MACGLLPLVSKMTEEQSKEAVVSGYCGVLHWLNSMLLLLNFSGWKDARRENSRKTSTQDNSPATGTLKSKWVCPISEHRGDCSVQIWGFCIPLPSVSNTTKTFIEHDTASYMKKISQQIVQSPSNHSSQSTNKDGQAWTFAWKRKWPKAKPPDSCLSDVFLIFLLILSTLEPHKTLIISGTIDDYFFKTSLVHE